MLIISPPTQKKNKHTKKPIRRLIRFDSITANAVCAALCDGFVQKFDVDVGGYGGGGDEKEVLKVQCKAYSYVTHTIDTSLRCYVVTLFPFKLNCTYLQRFKHGRLALAILALLRGHFAVLC